MDPHYQEETMKSLLALIVTLTLAGCANSQPAPQTRSDNETVSSLDYQECIQAAISGNGQASSAKCDPILKAPR